jgi:hypothetical protein
MATELTTTETRLAEDYLWVIDLISRCCPRTPSHVVWRTA